jgi:hypothetical protein
LEGEAAVQAKVVASHGFVVYNDKGNAELSKMLLGWRIFGW